MDDFEEAERYSVTETSDAFMPGEDFAIRDNETGNMSTMKMVLLLRFLPKMRQTDTLPGCRKM